MTFYPYVGARDPHAFESYLNAFDPEQRIDATLWSLAEPRHARMLDIGAGSGQLAVRFAGMAQHVFALEPDPAMLRQMHARLAHREQAGAPVSVLAASAEAIPLPDRSVDIVHARFAYFFGTDACLPGLREARRVLRPGGSFFVIEGSNLGDLGEINQELNPRWFADQTPILDFWTRHGFRHHVVPTVWRAADRESMLTALAMEQGAAGAARVVDRFPGLELSCAVHVFHWIAPDVRVAGGGA